MTGRKTCVLQVPYVFSYKALENFPNPLCETPGDTCSALFSHPVMQRGIPFIYVMSLTSFNVPKIFTNDRNVEANWMLPKQRTSPG